MPPITVKKSFKEGCVGVRVDLKSSNWPGDSVKVEGTTDLPSAQARELAMALIAEADRVDAKVAAKAASDERRRKYREREIAAGRLVVFSGLGK